MMRKIDTSYLTACEGWLDVADDFTVFLEPGVPPEVVESFERSKRINQKIWEEKFEREKQMDALVNEIKEKLNSDLSDRAQAIQLAVENYIRDSDVIKMIQDLRQSSKIILGVKEGSLAQAADYLLEGETVDGDVKEVQYVIDVIFDW